MSNERYTARGKTVDRILADFEDHLMDSTYEANTTDYLHAAVTAAAARAQERAADAQRRWAKIGAVAACASTFVAVAAVVVAAIG
jgi:predicted subunit of tRNA(5-methylaminomethyl-2-thiouridylate) methyltransferase